jgi:DNA mismatch repair protein MutS
VDITTGEFATTEFEDRDIWRAVYEELERLQLAELLVAEAQRAWLAERQAQLPAVHVTPYEDWHFELENARRALHEQFDVASLAGFGCERKPFAIRAAGAIVHYLHDTHQLALGQLMALTTYSTTGFMTLDPATRRNLELTQTARARHMVRCSACSMRRRRPWAGGSCTAG